MKSTYDVHVHMGQYGDIYYNPYKIIRVLAASGISHAYISTTTACMLWNNDYEKETIIRHIIAEIEEAINVAKDLKIDIRPLCWVVPKRYFEGETVATIMSEALYKGFKIHPLAHNWIEGDIKTSNLMDDICEYALSYSLPVFIHTGTSICDRIGRFEKWFERYDEVMFVLAHCKDYRETIRVFSKYSNVYGDISFCPTENVISMVGNGFSERLFFGTDFPITVYLKNQEEFNINDLYNEYKLLSNMSVSKCVSGNIELLL